MTSQLRPDFTVADLIALTQLHAAEIKEGANVWVDSESDYYTLKKDSTATVDSVNVVAPATGSPIAGSATAKWIRGSWLQFVVGAALTDTATQTVVRQGRFTWYTSPATLSQDSTVTLGTTGAEIGDIILITRISTSAHTLAVANGHGPTTIATMPNSKQNFVQAYWNGTDWVLMMVGTQ